VCRSYGDLPPCDVLRHVVGSIGWTRAWGAGSRECVARYLGGREGRVRADVAPPALQPPDRDPSPWVTLCSLFYYYLLRPHAPLPWASYAQTGAECY
jgi:hypothetical protein